MKHAPSISVITANLNTIDCIRHLVNCLHFQTDQEFTWIVVDGGSTDGSIELVENCGSNFNLLILKGQDFGIYDALNKGLRSCHDEYYLVVGADDTLEPGTIENYKSAIKRSDADIITAKVHFGSKVLASRGRHSAWLFGQSAIVSNHAVGTVIRRKLHNELGYYSNRFPIAADQIFIMKCLALNKRFYETDFIAGRFNQGGVSDRDQLGSITELYRIQLELNRNFTIQFLLLIYRMLKIRLHF